MDFTYSRDIKKACRTYINFVNQYKCTPLQLELIKEILKIEDEGLLKEVLISTSSIHGSISTQELLIAAAAELGNIGLLQKILAVGKSVLFIIFIIIY